MRRRAYQAEHGVRAVAPEAGVAPAARGAARTRDEVLASAEEELALTATAGMGDLRLQIAERKVFGPPGAKRSGAGRGRGPVRRQAVLASVSHRPAHGCRPAEACETFLKETRHWLQRAARMGADIVAFPEVYPQLAAGDRDVDDILAEFGLEPINAYFARARKTREKALAERGR